MTLLRNQQAGAAAGSADIEANRFARKADAVPQPGKRRFRTTAECVQRLMTYYDIGRDGIGWMPVVLTLMWLSGLAFGIWFARTTPIGRRGIFVWIVGWTTMGGVGFGNVWHQHFRRLRELESGQYLVVQGRVTSFSPQVGKANEQFTVGGITFHYNRANLGRGGMRSTGGYGDPLYVGADARVAYDADGVILRLEVR